MEVFECADCGHRAVRHIALDLDAIYASQWYFQSSQAGAEPAEAAGQLGYDDYQTISIGEWNAELFSALLLLEGAHSRSALDIGCATGTFLDFLKPFGVSTAGIEPSSWAASLCEQKGHQMVGQSFEGYSPDSGEYGLITAFHVIEHLTDPQASMQKISRLAGSRGGLLAVFPRVNFSCDRGWSGQHDSFEHISYFDTDFVKSNFRGHAGEPFKILAGPDLIYCFGGYRSPTAEAAIRLVEGLTGTSGPIADAEVASSLRQLSATAFLFCVTFIARNHSAEEARKLVVRTQELALFDANTTFLAEAFASYQNGNTLGVMSALSALENPSPGLANLQRCLREQVAGLSEKNRDSGYPLISVVLATDGDQQIADNFVRSVGRQTYPHLELIHAHCGESRPDAISPAVAQLVKSVDISGLDDSAALRKVQQACAGEWILWTDGSHTLSPFCVFALYEPLRTRMDSAAYPTTEEEASGSHSRLGSLWRSLTTRSSAPPIVLMHQSVFMSLTGHPSHVAHRRHLAAVLAGVPQWRAPDVLARRCSSTGVRP